MQLSRPCSVEARTLLHNRHFKILSVCGDEVERSVDDPSCLRFNLDWKKIQVLSFNNGTTVLLHFSLNTVTPFRFIDLHCLTSTFDSSV